MTREAIMSILDDLESLETLDSSGVTKTISTLAKQVNQAWEEASQIEIPSQYRDVQQIVFVGMGGSALGPHLLGSVYQPKITRPVLIVRDYRLPRYLGKKSLVILCSYSGNTEEVLTCAKQATKAGAYLLGVTSGGQLRDYCQDHQIPCYRFEPKFNPSAPRYGFGYMTIGPLAMLTSLQLIKVKGGEIPGLVKWLSQKDKDLNPKVPEAKNPAKKMALSLRERIPVLVAAEFLEGAAHIFTNQINETSKTFASYFVLPELNHHLMESLKYPSHNSKNLAFLFINSKYYSMRIRTRFEITKDVVNQNQIRVLEFLAQGKSRLGQAFEVVQFGSYVSFYLAMLSATDPSPNPWVDYFKEQLSIKDK